MTRKRKPYKTYSKEFKQEAVLLMEKPGQRGINANIQTL
jgi:transposase-like protein